jgi:hypothetical protein
MIKAETEQFFSPMRRTLARLLTRQLLVKLELRSEGQPSLAAAKERLAEWLYRNPDFWEESDDFEIWQRRITAC